MKLAISEWVLRCANEIEQLGYCSMPIDNLHNDKVSASEVEKAESIAVYATQCVAQIGDSKKMKVLVIQDRGMSVDISNDVSMFIEDQLRSPVKVYLIDRGVDQSRRIREIHRYPIEISAVVHTNMIIVKSLVYERPMDFGSDGDFDCTLQWESQFSDSIDC